MPSVPMEGQGGKGWLQNASFDVKLFASRQQEGDQRATDRRELLSNRNKSLCAMSRNVWHNLFETPRLQLMSQAPMRISNISLTLRAQVHRCANIDSQKANSCRSGAFGAG